MLYIFLSNASSIAGTISNGIGADNLVSCVDNCDGSEVNVGIVGVFLHCGCNGVCVPSLARSHSTIGAYGSWYDCVIGVGVSTGCVDDCDNGVVENDESGVGVGVGITAGWLCDCEEDVTVDISEGEENEDGDDACDDSEEKIEDVDKGFDGVGVSVGLAVGCVDECEDDAVAEDDECDDSEEKNEDVNKGLDGVSVSVGLAVGCVDECEDKGTTVDSDEEDDVGCVDGVDSDEENEEDDAGCVDECEDGGIVADSDEEKEEDDAGCVDDGEGVDGCVLCDDTAGVDDSDD
jgi:hypothetical protein